jgi:uncharacterized protein involved in type VI secretion and phage assembly
MNGDDGTGFQPFWGKYRGLVSDIQDPMGLGRIKARVPDVMGDEESGWALPCCPFGGDGMGLFGLPKVGGLVWIEFEQGNPDYPIWTGSWFGTTAELTDALAPPYKKTIIKTEGGNKIILDDTPGVGGITIETSGGQKIVMTSQGIEIDNGSGAKVKLAQAKVDVNNGALEVQ